MPTPPSLIRWRLQGSGHPGDADPAAHTSIASARLLSWEELPLHFQSDAGVKKSVKPVDELSGLAWHDASASGAASRPAPVVVAVGDGGLLFVAHNATDGSLHDWSSATLEAPNGEAFVDAESVAVLCPGVATICSLDGDEPATVLVGSENGDGRQARIAEYYLNGTVKQEDALGDGLLRLVGLDSLSQQHNLGFEAMALSPDKTSVLFTTEGLVTADARAPNARRFVLWNRVRRVGFIFCYEVQVDNAGITDVAFLDDTGNEVSVLERAYDETTNVIVVRMYYVNLGDKNTQRFAFSHSQKPQGEAARQEEREAITQAFHTLQPLKARLLFDFADMPQVLDNYEAQTRIPGERLLLVSDNNENAEQHTFLTTLQLEVQNGSAGDDAQDKQPPALVALGIVSITFIAILLMCVVKSALTRCFCPKAADYRDIDQAHDEIQPTRHSHVELQTLPSASNLAVI